MNSFRYSWHTWNISAFRVQWFGRLSTMTSRSDAVQRMFCSTRSTTWSTAINATLSSACSRLLQPLQPPLQPQLQLQLRRQLLRLQRLPRQLKLQLLLRQKLQLLLPSQRQPLKNQPRSQPSLQRSHQRLNQLVRLTLPRKSTMERMIFMWHAKSKVSSKQMLVWLSTMWTPHNIIWTHDN